MSSLPPFIQEALLSNVEVRFFRTPSGAEVAELDHIPTGMHIVHDRELHERTVQFFKQMDQFKETVFITGCAVITIVPDDDFPADPLPNRFWVLNPKNHSALKDVIRLRFGRSRSTLALREAEDLLEKLACENVDYSINHVGPDGFVLKIKEVSENWLTEVWNFNLEHFPRYQCKELSYGDRFDFRRFLEMATKKGYVGFGPYTCS